MASFLTIKNSSGVTKPFLFIDHSVGRRGRNKRDDVYLIQFMLNEIGRADGRLKGENCYRSPDPVNLKFNGLCGTETISEILAFQRACNKEKGFAFVAEDSRVDSTRKAISGDFKFTTLYVLNSEFFFSLVLRKMNLEFALKEIPIPTLFRGFFDD
jgi:hypothetical protein